MNPFQIDKGRTVQVFCLLNAAVSTHFFLLFRNSLVTAAAVQKHSVSQKLQQKARFKSPNGLALHSLNRLNTTAMVIDFYFKKNYWPPLHQHWELLCLFSLQASASHNKYFCLRVFGSEKINYLLILFSMCFLFFTDVLMAAYLVQVFGQ